MPKMQKQDFTLHFSMPLDTQDWENLMLSRVQRVMLPLSIQQPATLAQLRTMNVRVVFRLDENDYYSDDAPQRIVERVRSNMGICSVEAVIMGCEPENVVPSLGYDANDWGQNHAFEHVRRLDALRAALRVLPHGPLLIAPGWTARSITEDSPPAPGMLTWRDICRDAYWRCDGVGGHLYEFGWTWVDALRLKFNLQKLQELFHLNIYIDELGVPGDDLTQMNAYIEIADLIMKSPLGNRVRMLSPFVSNGDPGNPPSWDPKYLLRNPDAYRKLGAWISS